MILDKNGNCPYEGKVSTASEETLLAEETPEMFFDKMTAETKVQVNKKHQEG